MILPYERLLIPQYDSIRTQHMDALLDSGGILNKELNFISGLEAGKSKDYAEGEQDENLLLKYKASEREHKREKRSA